MWPIPQETAGLVNLLKKSVMENFIFLCSARAWKWVVEVCLDRGCVEFAIAGWLKVKLFNFINWSWSNQSDILPVMVSKSCFWWFDSQWSELKPRKLLKTGLMCLLELFQGGKRGWRPLELHVLFKEIVLGGWNVEKWVDYLKRRNSF